MILSKNTSSQNTRILEMFLEVKQKLPKMKNCIITDKFLT